VDLPKQVASWRKTAQRPWVAGLLQTVIVGGTAIVGVTVLSLSAQRVLLADLRQSLGQIAQTAAAHMDGDAHRRLVGGGEVSPAQYAAAVKPLQILLRSNHDLRFAYSAILRGDAMLYAFDADPEHPSNFLEADPDPPLPSERAVWATQRLTVEQAPSATSWGVGIRAYAPIRDYQGQMVAYVGVTMRAERYVAEVTSIRSATLLGAAVALLLSLISGVWMFHTRRTRDHALQAAFAASRAKSEFLATMSHEIRTPLNGVLGMAELLLRSHLPAQQHRWAETVHSSGRLLLGVINDVLDFSKIEAGRMMLETVELDLVDLIEETVVLFGEPAQRKGLELAVMFTPLHHEPLRVWADPLRLR
jgi:signal transduction histidine kinase